MIDRSMQIDHRWSMCDIGRSINDDIWTMRDNPPIDDDDYPSMIDNRW